MNKREFESFFRAEILPSIKERYEHDGIDYPARREAWNDQVDLMVKVGSLPRRAFNWSNPFSPPEERYD